jgi:glycosyltransferase involved in cell wall biosynthesis
VTLHPADATLRLAFICGHLGHGGAERQLFYMVRALIGLGATVRVYTLYREGLYAERLAGLGCPPIWVGQKSDPPRRVWRLAGQLRKDRIDILQSSHTFTNLYAALAGRLAGVPSIGAVRNTLGETRQANGHWTRWHLRLPHMICANSEAAVRSLVGEAGLSPERVFHLPNAIDLAGVAPVGNEEWSHPAALLVGRLVPVKRVDRFIEAIHRARQTEPGLVGVIIGDGPERGSLEQRARDLGLDERAVRFLGPREDARRLMGSADMLVLTSDHEGLPNVILEAMAARLPVVTTPAGDASRLVVDGQTGCVVGFDDVEGMAARMVELARSPARRRQMGEAGFRRAEEAHGFPALRANLVSLYLQLARVIRSRDLEDRTLPLRAAVLDAPGR